MQDQDNTPASGEYVEVIPSNTSSLSRWAPEVGEKTLNLLSTLALDEESKQRVLSEARGILSRCIPPTLASGRETGLVVGYVQSGKTMSFTTVAALAADNNYPLVIAIVGTSIPLFNQSVERLKKDLGIDRQNDFKWKHLSNPRKDKQQSIASSLVDWQDPSVTKKQTVLLTVMKHVTHLKKLNELLSTLRLQGVPVLVIDDEADQAGLNANAYRGTTTPTYDRIIALREALPHH